MKFLLAAVALACVAAVYADECGPLQRLKVKRQWAYAYGESGDRGDFGIVLWTHFFSEHPEARAVFDRVNGDNEFSDEFMAHSSRVLSGLDMCIALLDDQETLSAELAHLKGQHDERNLDAALFGEFKQSLGRALAKRLGRRFDKASWSACYDLIATGITG